ncbi:MAG: MazG nucleotide pyrophosphohydrolase domain-containing protein [bacterium]|nr:MazG nucleotide pyrophosphohydrolase domain-containing protein [bacterium]
MMTGKQTNEMIAVLEAEGGSRPQSLTDWARMFDSIFGAHDREHYSDSELRERLLEEVIFCFESLRKERLGEIERHLPVIVSWYFGLTNRMKIDVAAAAWHKYPGICPDCRAVKSCNCISHDAAYDEKLRDLTQYRRDTRLIPSSLEAWQEMHKRIYGPINKLSSFASVFYHLAEEAAEFSTECRLGNRENMEAEAADVFLWVLAVTNKFEVSLADLAWKRYPYECDTCHAQKCACPKQ